MGIIPATTFITNDELALGYYEINEQAPDSRGFHRYKIIRVIRNGKPAEYREDMGLAKRCKRKKQVAIPAMLQHTVGELRDIADKFVNHTGWDIDDWRDIDKWDDDNAKGILKRRVYSQFANVNLLKLVMEDSK